MDQLSLDVIVTRGALVESRHRVHAAVVNASGTLIGAARDAAIVSHWRSCAKPFQIMPFIESGGFDTLAWGDDQLALACASHGGEPEHVAIAQAMLASIGMEEGDLVCGPDDPLSPARTEGLREGRKQARTSAQQLLGQARGDAGPRPHGGWPSYGTSGTITPFSRRVSTRSRDGPASQTSTSDSPSTAAVSRCFVLGLEAMALAYARLADAGPAGRPRSHRASCTRCRRAPSSSAAPIASIRR
jgi:L-asparaginase II